MLRYLEEVRRRMGGWSVAVAWRHRSWVDGQNRLEMARVLRELGIAYLVADCPRVEWAPPPEVEVTADWSVVRLHGRNEAGWAERGAGVEAAYDYLYSEEELREWVPVVRRIAQETERLFVMFNNCTRGQAVVNAGQMMLLLSGLS